MLNKLSGPIRFNHHCFSEADLCFSFYLFTVCRFFDVPWESAILRHEILLKFQID